MAKENKDQKVEKPSVPSTQFEFGGAKYRFTVAHFRIPGLNNNQPILAKDALQEEEILEHLVNIKSGVIEKTGDVAPADETRKEDK
ncbi:MAG: hypothetical protein HC831_31735 [Chloroflexia bacterium]|nr:hypothetical protein [Chloroflexia bacterium]